MNIYLPNGYLNVPLVMRPLYTNPFIFNKIIMVGSRGTGKSFGVLDELSINHSEKYFYIRTQVSELDLMKDPELNPYNALNRLRGTDFEIVKGANNTTRSLISGDKRVAMLGALANMSKVRGMDAFEYKALFYDEFIPEPHVRKLKKQGTAIKALFETLNRNRELEGEPPMRLIMCANSDDLNNDVLITYDVLDDLLEMRDRGLEVKDFPERGLRLVYTLFSPIAKAKAQTANYKGQEGSDYNRMALDNEFTGYYRGNLKSQDLKNYKPVVSITGLCIYRSKTDKTYYVTRHMSGEFPEIYGGTDFERGRFQRKYFKLLDTYYRKLIKFESAGCEIAFINLWEVKK